MFSGLTDMARDESEKDATPLMPQENKYPYGLQFSLEESDLEKLDVDHTDFKVGDSFPLDILAKIVSISSNESEGGQSNCCVRFQITHIEGEEHEDTIEEAEEHEEEEPSLEKHGYLRYK